MELLGAGGGTCVPQRGCKGRPEGQWGPRYARVHTAMRPRKGGLGLGSCVGRSATLDCPCSCNAAPLPVAIHHDMVLVIGDCDGGDLTASFQQLTGGGLPGTYLIACVLYHLHSASQHKKQ